MKKLLLLFAIILFSCTQLPKEQEVVFNRTLVESGSMTRATSQEHAEIKNLIQSTYQSFPVYLYIEDNQSIMIEFGEAYTVPIGTWYMDGSTTIESLGQVSATYTIAESPSLVVSTDIEIQWGVAEYDVPAEIKSAGILYNLEEVKEVRYCEFGSNTYKKVNTSVFSEHYGLFFINGYFSGTTAAYFKLIPNDGPMEETIFCFSAEYVNDSSSIHCNLASGKYYILHPSAVTELDGISFNLGIPDWECGLE